jgi:hypothetical protein
VRKCNKIMCMCRVGSLFAGKHSLSMRLCYNIDMHKAIHLLKEKHAFVQGNHDEDDQSNSGHSRPPQSQSWPQQQPRTEAQKLQTENQILMSQLSSTVVKCAKQKRSSEQDGVWTVEGYATPASSFFTRQILCLNAFQICTVL